MTATGRALFATAIGTCGVAWGPEGIVAVQLPEADARRTGARLAARCPGFPEAGPPPEVAAALEAIAALLDGEPRDLAEVRVDLGAVSPFERRVLDHVRTIPPGRTETYGEVAAAVGEPGGAQAVGRALGANPVPIVVPCHRVMGAGGRPVGFSAHGGVGTKLRILRIEGSAAPTLFD